MPGGVIPHIGPSSPFITSDISFKPKRRFFGESLAESIFQANSGLLTAACYAMEVASESEKNLFRCRIAKLHVEQRAFHTALDIIHTSPAFSNAVERAKQNIIKAEAYEHLKRPYVALLWYKHALRELSPKDRLVASLVEKCQALYTKLKNQNEYSFNEVVLLAKTFCPLDLFATRVADGDAKAMIYLGFCYEKGVGVPKNSAQALELYQTAADLNEPLAYFRLGSMEKDSIEAIRFYEAGERLDDISSVNALARCYLTGEGVQQNFDRAYELIQRGLKKQSPESICLKGLLHVLRDEDYKQAAILYRQAVDHGNFLGMLLLADCYLKGEGVRRDPVVGMELLQILKSLGYIAAIYNLGSVYYLGLNGTRNLQKAFALYKRTADNNYAMGKRSVGICYLKGKGIKKDLVKAKRYLEEAVQGGDVFAKQVLISAYPNALEETSFWDKKMAFVQKCFLSVAKKSAE